MYLQTNGGILSNELAPDGSGSAIINCIYSIFLLQILNGPRQIGYTFELKPRLITEHH